MSVINEEICYNNKYSYYSKSLFYSIKNIEKYTLGLSQHVDQKKKYAFFGKITLTQWVMCVEINLNNNSEDACTCKYVHAGQNYIVQIRNEFYIIDRSMHLC